jgi:hypothetical protein
VLPALPYWQASHNCSGPNSIRQPFSPRSGSHRAGTDSAPSLPFHGFGSKPAGTTDTTPFALAAQRLEER